MTNVITLLTFLNFDRFNNDFGQRIENRFMGNIICD